MTCTILDSCVKSLRSSYTGLYSQKTPKGKTPLQAELRLVQNMLLEHWAELRMVFLALLPDPKSPGENAPAPN